MRFTGLIHASKLRARQPGPWSLLVLGGAWALLRWMLDLPFGRYGPIEAFLPLAMILGGLCLAPAAWQWNGDEAPLASPGRGLLQSLFLNGLWVALLLGVFGVFGPPPSPPMGPPERRPPPPFEEDARRPPPPQEEPPRPPERRPAGPPGPHRPEVLNFLVGLLLTTVLGRFIAEREAAEQREIELRVLNEKAQALALQSQMQPHALFNALSGLVELTREDPEATEEALVALCDYLRLLMTHVRAEVAPLRLERELLENYLRIEQIRLGERLRVKWDWPDWADPIALPPLFMQPLVENAVLHGIAATAEGGELCIGIHRANGWLHLKVDNTGKAPEGEKEGLGLGHLRKRLLLWGGSRAQLELVREGAWTRARLTVPLPS